MIELHEVTGEDVWQWYDEGYRLVITTNGVVRRDGACVMGAGIAKQVKQRFPRFPFALGHHIQTYGNVPGFFFEYGLVSMPVKHRWDEDADLDLIEASAKEICRTVLAIREFDPHGAYASVRPGCGNGKLTWNDVRPVIGPYFAKAGILVVER